MSVEPTSLVMRKLKCFYCDETQVWDKYAADGVFGIRHCDTHRPNADQDILRFYHESERVLMADLRLHPGISPVLTRFDAPVFIKRTNGDIDYDWTIRISKSPFPFLMYKIHGRWCLPMTHPSGVIKDVPLQCFTTEELSAVNGFSDEFCDSIDTALNYLDDGIYKTQSENPEKACVSIAETPGVVTINLPVGPIRVFIPA